MRLGDWFWRMEGYLQLAYLFYWPELSVGSQGIPVGVGGWDKAMCETSEVWGRRSV